MKLRAPLIVISLVLISAVPKLRAQSILYDMEFRYEHSRRIKNHAVIVHLGRRGDSCFLQRQTLDMNNSDTSDQPIKSSDTSFNIALKDYENLTTKVLAISSQAILKNIDYGGFDGTSWNISFGGIGGAMSYTVWTPESKTMQRNLVDFVKVSRIFIEMSGLKTDEILN
jgi:hypothetical protein